MEFSDTWQHSGSCGFSPDGALMAIATGDKLIVRSVASLDVSHRSHRFDQHVLDQICDTRSTMCGSIAVGNGIAKAGNLTSYARLTGWDVTDSAGVHV